MCGGRPTRTTSSARIAMVVGGEEDSRATENSRSEEGSMRAE